MRFFDVTDKTLDRGCKETYGKLFSEVFQEKRGLGKISLRRNQWRLAEKSATMAIGSENSIWGRETKLRQAW